MTGAPSNTDTFDLKVGAWTPADFNPTSYNGVLFPQGLMPNLANQLNRLAIVRNLRAPALVHPLQQIWAQIARSPSSALGKASGKPVARIASDWTTQPGFPVIEVDAHCKAGRQHIALRQEQFRLGSGEPPGDRLWSVPLKVSRVGATNQVFTLMQDRGHMLVQPGCGEALLVVADVRLRAEVDGARTLTSRCERENRVRFVARERQTR